VHDALVQHLVAISLYYINIIFEKITWYFISSLQTKVNYARVILYGSLRTLKFCFNIFDNSMLVAVYSCHIIPTPLQHVFSTAQPYK
jgi:hypothetical protein